MKNLIYIFILFFAFDSEGSNLKQFFSGSGKSLKTQEWTSPGSFTWIRPAGVDTVNIECWGAGGGGGGASVYNVCSTTCRPPSGGDGGLYIKKDNFPVSGNQTVIIGAGGTGGTANAAGPAGDGGNGGQSSFGTLIASGGAGGRGSYYTPSSGGSATGVFTSTPFSAQAKGAVPNAYAPAVCTGASFPPATGGTGGGTRNGCGGGAGKGDGGSGSVATGVAGGSGGTAAGGGGGNQESPPSNGGSGGDGYCIVTWQE